MVGLVIVSHSRSLAEALVDLIEQVTNAEIPVAIAAGIGPDRSEFGTDALEIMEAVQSVYSEDGVMILMDLGSAILSAEMAVELLPPEIAEKVRFCAAPVVEGAIAAGVQIGLNASLDAVCDEARSALLPKIDHITEAQDRLPDGVVALQPSSPPVSPSEEFEEVVVTLKNLHGLHARPAARFVQTAASHDGQILLENLTNGKGPVSAKSLNAVTTLGAVKDHSISIKAFGLNANQVLQELSVLVESGFGEPTEAVEKIELTPPEISAGKGGDFQAVPISEGIAVGPLYRYRPPVPQISDAPADDPNAEWKKLKGAIVIAGTNISQRRAEIAQSIGESEAEIFSAHQLILEDPDLQEGAKHLIFEQNKNAAAAWDEVIRKTADTYLSLDDPYLQQRSADVLDVGNQVLFALAGEEDVGKIELEGEVILYAHDLSPTETSRLDMKKVLGIITSGGGPTSHSAILSRGLGIPAISGVSADFERKKDGIKILMDGFTGNIWINPGENITQEMEEKREEWLKGRELLILASTAPAATKDGTRIEVAANVGSAQDAEAALKNGAEGIGLLRTEFLFLTRKEPPTEEDQFQILREIGQAISINGKKDRPVIVRTLDVGGDKDLPYLDLPVEENPFLGVRAIRMSLRNPNVFLTQLRAILRAGEDLNFKIMFPMVANLEEVKQAKGLLEEAHQSLVEQQVKHKWPIETGIMIEIPAAAILSSEIASNVDFFSIGTNDLTQYTLAAERGNPVLANMNDALHPAVLRLVDQVIKGAHHKEKWVGVCGELAGDPIAAPVLTGLGVDELSMNPGSIPRVKAVLKSISLHETVELANNVLNTDSSDSARLAAKKFLEERDIEI